jgi:ElaA protein
MSLPITPAVAWKRVAFADLTPHQLYELLQLRYRRSSWWSRPARSRTWTDWTTIVAVHLLGHGACRPSTGEGQGAPLIAMRAWSRRAWQVCTQASVGRVITAPAARGTALGHRLIAQACTQLAQLWGAQPIRIGAQAHLQAFYGRHGFVAEGAGYIEDGIPHVEMLRPAQLQRDIP